MASFVAQVNQLVSKNPVLLKQTGLSALNSLKHVNIDYPLIHAAAQFWDIEDHVFRFGFDELAPTFEEFNAFLGLTTPKPICMPHFSLDFDELITEILDLPPCALTRDPQGLSLPHLHRAYEESSLTPRQKGYHVIYILLSHFLLVATPRYGNPKAIALCKDMSEGHLPTMIILAETFSYLDRLKKHFVQHSATDAIDFDKADSVIPSGSPLLLQIWLQERFSFVVPPEDPSKYNLNQYHTRKFFVKLFSPLGYFNWFWGFRFIIRWSLPWYTLTKISRPHPPAGVVPLSGLTETSFSNTKRILRQFGLEQKIPSEGSPFPITPLNLMNLMDVWWYWGALRQSVISTNTGTTAFMLLSPQYQGWLMDKIIKKDRCHLLSLDDVHFKTPAERAFAGIPQEGVSTAEIPPRDQVDEVMAAVNEGFMLLERRRRKRRRDG